MTSIQDTRAAAATLPADSLTDQKRMSWLATTLNPTGKSPKVHFTRVWTLCFMLQLLIIVLPVFVGIVIGLAGGDASGLQAFGAFATPVVFIVTTVMSFVAHSRRLNDAGKTSLWAILVLIPLVVALFLFSGAVGQKSAAYDGLYKQRTEFLEDPQAWRDERLAQRKAAQERGEAFKAFNAEAKPLFFDAYLGRADAMRSDTSAWRTDSLEAFASLKDTALELAPPKPEAEDAEGGDAEAAAQPAERGQQRGGWNNGPRADQPLPSKVDFILKPNLMTIQLVMIGLSFFVMWWSLLWVARLPSKAKI